ncbi:MAG: RluA family pseudouridine synthase [Sphaerochaetaceae bacterium]
MNSDIGRRILYEDNHLIVINKLPGELAQGDKTGDITLADTVKEYLKKTYNKQGNVFLGIPHRLDRPTSGVIVFAKTSKALTRMNQLFRSSEDVEKIYWAVVDKLPTQPEGRVVHYLSRNEAQNKSTATDQQRKNSKEAVMEYEIKGASDNYYLLEIRLITGRQHQIRAQLAAMGSHIKGDLKYGAKRSNPGGGIHLHARSLAFAHPVSKQKLLVVAPPPTDALWEYLSS